MTPAAFSGVAMLNLSKPGNSDRVSGFASLIFTVALLTGSQLMEVNPDAIPEKIYPHIQF